MNINILEGWDSFTLPNGLKVMLKEDTQLPQVVSVMGYRVGSVHETKGMTGSAHFLEHVMFKGTKKFAKGKIDEITYKAGGENNAFTSDDCTIYHFRVSPEWIGTILEIEADRMRNCLFDPVEFDKERGVVIEEMNRQMDTPEGKLWIKFASNVFQKLPYHATIGERKDLESVPLKDVIDFYNRYYVPNNAILVVAGAINKDDVKKKITDLFSPIPKGDFGKANFGEEPKGKARKIVMEEKQQTSRVLVGFASSKVATKDDYVLDVVSNILAGGRNARLPKKLAEELKLVPDGGVSTSNWSRRYAGVFTLRARALPVAKAEQIEKAILAELERMKSDGVTDKELQKAKANIQANYLYEKEGLMSFCQDLAYMDCLESPDYIKTYLDKVNSVTADDIKEVAARIFASPLVVISPGQQEGGGGGTEKKDEKKNQRKCSIDKEWTTEFSPEGEGAAAAKFGEVLLDRSDSGLTVVAKRVGSVPIVTIKLFVKNTRLYEKQDKAGTAALMGDLLDQGVRTPDGTVMTFSQIAEEVEMLGARMDTNSNGVEIKVPAWHFDKAVEIVKNLALYPSFPKDRFEKVRADMIAGVKAKADDPRTMATDMFRSLMYAGSVLANPSTGTEQSLAAITLDDVKEIYHSAFRPDNAIIVVTGQIEPSVAATQLKASFGEWIEEEVPLVLPQVKTNPSAQAKSIQKNTEQVQIMVGWPTVSRNDSDYHALAVAEYVFGSGSGFTDRLSKAVRDEKGYAYEVWGTFTANSDWYPGIMMMYAGTKNDNRQACRELMYQVLKDFVANGPSEEEVANAKNYILHSIYKSWETTSSVANYIVSVVRLNLGFDHDVTLRSKINALTLAEIKSAVQRRINPNQVVEVLVGK